MRALGKWRRLPEARRAALLEAFAAVAYVRLGLRVLRWPTWERVTGRMRQDRRPDGTALTTVQDVAWAVERVSRAIPGATCLTQALAARLLLSRRGHASRLKIGVTRPAGERLRAHAWLESEGRIVLGGGGVEAYTPLNPSPSAGDDRVVPGRRGSR